MQVIESYICGKENNPNTCEDGIFIGKHLLAVIDGVTAKGTRLWNNTKSGHFAKDVLISTLQKLDACQDENMLYEAPTVLLTKLDAILHDAVTACAADTLTLEEYPRASVIIYNNVTKQIISYGDCQCSVNGKVYSHVKKIDVLNSNLRAYYLEYYLQQGMSLTELAANDLGRAAIQENLMLQFSFENKIGEFGYAVLNGMGIEPSLMKVYQVSEGDEIILASDGYPVLASSLAESEAILQHVLLDDPMCFRIYRCTKGIKTGNVSFDDRAYCRVSI